MTKGNKTKQEMLEEIKKYNSFLAGSIKGRSESEVRKLHKEYMELTQQINKQGENK